eukprot:3861192-Rhodomonas_salina.6
MRSERGLLSLGTRQGVESEKESSEAAKRQGARVEVARGKREGKGEGGEWRRQNVTPPGQNVISVGGGGSARPGRRAASARQVASERVTADHPRKRARGQEEEWGSAGVEECTESVGARCKVQESMIEPSRGGRAIAAS